MQFVFIALGPALGNSFIHNTFISFSYSTLTYPKLTVLEIWIVC